MKLDLDSTVIETYGLNKQGGSGFTYLNTRGYHPLLAVIAETGEIVHSRLREGKASSGRGASSFARQALARLKRLSLLDEIVVRADSGFYAEKVVAACQAHDARFSISVRLQKSHHQLIAAIPEEEWKPIPLLPGGRRRRGRDRLPALRKEADLPDDRAPGGARLARDRAIPLAAGGTDGVDSPG